MMHLLLSNYNGMDLYRSSGKSKLYMAVETGKPCAGGYRSRKYLKRVLGVDWDKAMLQARKQEA